jgi:hypothetical protein
MLKALCRSVAIASFAVLFTFATPSGTPDAAAQTKPDCPTYQNCIPRCVGGWQYRTCDVYQQRATYYGGRAKWSCTQVETVTRRHYARKC